MSNKRFLRLFGPLSSVLVVFLVIGTPNAQRRSAFWYTVAGAASSGSAQMFERLVAAIVSASYDVAASGVVQAEALHEELRRRKPGELIVLAADSATVAELVRTDQSWKTLPALGLEVLNVRAAAAPFYLFAQAGLADGLRTQSGAALRVVYVDRLGTLQPADVAGLLDPLLRTKSVVVGPLESPRELARRLLTNTADVVAVYDQDPSSFRDDFLAEYELIRPRGDAARLQAVRLVVFPTTEADYAADRLQVAANNLTYAIVRYDDLAFHDAKDLIPTNRADGLLAVSPPAATAGTEGGLLVLSNVRRVVGDPEVVRLRRLLSHAYVGALVRPEADVNRCGAAQRPIYRPYLLNAHLADRESLVKGLALWSDLQLTVGTARTADRALVEDQVRLVETMLSERLDFQVGNHDDWTSLAGKLSASASVREQFSGQEATLFRQAVDSIGSALASQGPDRRARLDSARAKLVELIRRGIRPACVKGGSEGLFDAREFDPFFYLGLIDAHLALESR
jgi:hypothetical protein